MQVVFDTDNYPRRKDMERLINESICKRNKDIPAKCDEMYRQFSHLRAISRQEGSPVKRVTKRKLIRINDADDDIEEDDADEDGEEDELFRTQDWDRIEHHRPSCRCQ